MRVPMTVDYGVRALIDLAQNDDLGPVPTSEIASRQSVPEPYLEQLLSTLNKFGLIKSRRGPQGGHVLAIRPDQINLGMVVEILGSNSAPLNCIEEPEECIQYSVCTQRDVWQSVDQVVQSVLSFTSIGELAQRQIRAKAPAGMYQI